MGPAQAFAPVLVANGGEAKATPWVKSNADVEMLMKMKTGQSLELWPAHFLWSCRESNPSRKSL